MQLVWLPVKALGPGLIQKCIFCMQPNVEKVNSIALQKVYLFDQKKKFQILWKNVKVQYNISISYF